MTPLRDPNVILAAWLDEGPTDLPESTRRAIVDATRTTSQTRHAWRAPRRYIEMHLTARAAIAVLAIAVIGGALLFVLPRISGVGGPPASSASPTPTPCQSPIAVGSPLATNCRFVSGVFRPAVSMAGDPRWQSAQENSRSLDLNVTLPGGQPNSEGIAFVTIDRLATTPCQAGGVMTDHTTVPFQPTSPNSGPGDIFAWIATRTPLKFPAPQAVTIAGHQGVQSTLDVPDGDAPACGGTVWFTWTTDGASTDGQYAVAFAGLKWRLTAIDIQGTTVVIQTFAPADRFGTLLVEADKLLASARFE